MPSTVRRGTRPLTVTDVVAAGRRMLRAGTPTNPREIRERMDAIDAVMGCLTGANYGSDFYVKLGREWSRLAAALSGGSSRSRRVLRRTPNRNISNSLYSIIWINRQTIKYILK